MSFTIALSGISAVNSDLDAISNNIANSGTFGFKSSRAVFSALYAGTQATGAEVTSMSQSIGVGGGVLTTGRAMDVSIGGRGFFVSRDSMGQQVFTRVGMFNVDKDGWVVDNVGRRVQGYGSVPGSSALGAMGDLQVPTGQIAARPSTKLDYVGNMSSDWTVPSVTPFVPADADPLSFNGSNVSLVYDSLGSKHSITQYFVKTGPGAVTVHYMMDGASVGAPTNLTFDSDGKLTAPTAPVTLNLGTPAGASALSIDVNYTGTTQFAGEATTTVNAADGYASGALIGTQIDEDGGIMAQYSNGEKLRVGTLAIATMPNESELTAVGDTSWVANNRTGTPLFFAPGSAMAGKLSTGMIENSNVDMTSELVALMSAQRNYQANTKVLSTENEMMQSLMQAV